MTLPIDRTAKSALDSNLVNGFTSDAPKVKASNDVVYNTIDELYNYALNLAGNGYTKTQIDNIIAQAIFGTPPAGGVHKTQLGTDVIDLINSKDPQLINIERNQANLIAIAEINSQSLPQSGYGYDLFRGSALNLYSCAILDTFATNVAATIAAGATSVTLPTVAGLAAGREITLQDIVTESKRERLIISNIVGNAVTFTTPTVNAYAAQAKVYRSLGKVDTTAKKLLFGGASYQASQSAASTVVASAYDTSGNGGKKEVMLSNGWIVATANGPANVAYIFVSKDNGQTWQQLCTISSAGVPAITSFQNKVTALFGPNGTNMYSVTFDATTVTNIDLNSTKVSVDSGQTSTGTFSIALALDGSLHAAWCSKNATNPNSWNIRYSKSTDGGVTWAAPTQITTNNTTGTDVTNPCIVVRSNNNPVIVAQYVVSTTTNSILAWVYSGTAWTASAGITIYAGAANAQSNPCDYIKTKGSNIGRIVCRWQGKDATDSTFFNERWSYSDDGGATWSAMAKVTTGNTIDRQKGVLCEDASGNIFDVYMDGAGISYQSLPNGTTTWGGLTTLDAAGTNPAVVDQLDFTVPLTLYMSASTVKFKGTWVTTTTLPLTQEDIRYNITPPTGLMKELRSWIQYDVLTGFTVDSALSIVDSAANESFAAMTPTVTDYTTYKENYFDGFVTTAKAKGTQRVTMKRATVNDNVGESKYLAAMIGG